MKGPWHLRCYRVFDSIIVLSPLQSSVCIRIVMRIDTTVGAAEVSCIPQDIRIKNINEFLCRRRFFQFPMRVLI